jgi:hypothetical protein
MNKMLLAICITALVSSSTYACDICGCGAGNNYIGILPDFQKNIFGLRYRYNSLLTHAGPDGSTTYLTTKEQYRTMELWCGWNISERIRIMGNIPFSFNAKENQGATKNKNGLGDISLAGFYQILNSRKTTSSQKLLVQSLWAGGGIKLPTGKYNPADKEGSNQNLNLFQLGTGSTDFSLNAMYDVRLNDVGLNVAGGYKITTTNKEQYAYGNKLNISTQVYHKFRIGNSITLAPNVGALYENAVKDLDNQVVVDVSGGNILMGTLGLETVIKKITFGANWQTPIYQNLAGKQVIAKDRAMIHVSFTFEKNANTFTS